MASLAERQENRRRVMLDAGIAFLGSESGALSVRGVCRSTGITERYFYTAFGTRDDYARAIFDDVSARARAVLLTAVEQEADRSRLPAAAVTAFIELMIDHPEAGRVLLLAPSREPALSGRGLSQMPGFFSVVASALPAETSRTARQLVSVTVVGALTAMFTEYLSGRLTAGREELLRFGVRLVEGAPAQLIS